MDTRNIFELIGEFKGVNEDQLTAGFGALLGNDDELMVLFLRRLGLFLDIRSAKKVKIETQVWKDANRLDLKISYLREFIIYVEVKVEAAVSEIQIKNYLRKLNSEKYKKKRFVLLTIRKEDTLSKIAPRVGFKKKDTYHLLWNEIYDFILFVRPKSKKEFLFNQFIKRWKHTMEGELDPQDYRLEELQEVMVVVVEPECMENIRQKRMYVPPSGKKNFCPVQYLAFYVSNPIKELKYLAQVEKIMSDVPKKDMPKGYYYHKTGTYPQVFLVRKPVELSNRLKGNKSMNIWGARYVKLTSLLDSKNKTVDDLELDD